MMPNGRAALRRPSGTKGERGVIQSVAFAGLGSVGAIYAQLAARCAEVPCFGVVGDAQSYMQRPVSVNGERLTIPLRTAEQGGEKADLLIVAVKWYALETVLEETAPFVGENTVILSLLNGVTSEETIARRFPQARVLPAFGSGIDSNRTGREVNMNRRGQIVFGPAVPGRDDEAVEAVRAYFERAGIPHEVRRDMLRPLWWKLMVNVGMNQVSAVMGLPYGPFRESAEAMARMHRAQREVVAVARAQGIGMDETDIARWDAQLAGLSEAGMSSTLQDVRACRKTEVELYGEEVCRQGEALGVPTPENRRLVNEIHNLESAYLLRI